MVIIVISKLRYIFKKLVMLDAVMYLVAHVLQQHHHHQNKNKNWYLLLSSHQNRASLRQLFWKTFHQNGLFTRIHVYYSYDLKKMNALDRKQILNIKIAHHLIQVRFPDKHGIRQTSDIRHVKVCRERDNPDNLGKLTEQMLLSIT